jgi:hypothetical protein
LFAVIRNALAGLQVTPEVVAGDDRKFWHPGCFGFLIPRLRWIRNPDSREKFIYCTLWNKQ